MQALNSQLGGIQPTSVLLDTSFDRFLRGADQTIGAEQPLGNAQLQSVTRSIRVDSSLFAVFLVLFSDWAAEVASTSRAEKLSSIVATPPWARLTAIAATPTSKLEELKHQQFRAETRDERIVKALAALDAPSRLNFAKDQWKDAADNPELEEEE